ncbi:Lipoprotein signal peptidase [Heracleum sosnowskyi]|uniref:Lipoprotein signal peptidase n=1 Tax=Heracleum sosnowskyi TaxID=360622 RepID=A0AAD8I2C2_9APIA|nr:Lipoprotein signal peptidase [Heracleum sosnowskyi]
MGYKNINSVMFYMWVSLLLLESLIPRMLATDTRHYDPLLFDDFVHEYAEKAVKKPRTGTLYNITLPSNYSGVEVSYMRLKSGSLWRRGKNSSLFKIPKRILPSPYVNRIDIVFQNVGKLSSSYFNIPNYTFVAPVIGFHIYGVNVSSSDGSRMLTISLQGDPIVVQFSSLSLDEKDNATMKCVRFGADGTEVEFSSVNAPDYTCNAHNQGHFSIVVPSLQPPSAKKRKRREKLWFWLLIGGGGFVFLILCGILVFKMFRAWKIEGLVKESDRSVALDMVWIGESWMPSAGGIRTQPILENDYVP